jgi:hypothetical protein
MKEPAIIDLHLLRQRLEILREHNIHKVYADNTKTHNGHSPLQRQVHLQIMHEISLLQDIILSSKPRLTNVKNILETYDWIKIKKYEDDDTLSSKEPYKKLEAHHVEETTFLINKVREIVSKN